MSFTDVGIEPTGTYPTQVDVHHASGLPVDDSDGALSDRCFGIDPDGVAYFDPAGASAGDLAPLAWDSSRGYFLLIRGAARYDDPHAMRLAQRVRVAARHAPAPVPDGAMALAQQVRLAARHAPASSPDGRLIGDRRERRVAARHPSVPPPDGRHALAQQARLSARHAPAPARDSRRALERRERRYAARHPAVPAPDGRLALERTVRRWQAAGNRKRLARLESTTL